MHSVDKCIHAWNGPRSEPPQGLVRGAYHFGHPGTDAVAQAQFFVQHVRAAGGFTSGPTLPLMLDLGAQLYACV